MTEQKSLLPEIPEETLQGVAEFYLENYDGASMTEEQAYDAARNFIHRFVLSPENEITLQIGLAKITLIKKIDLVDNKIGAVVDEKA